MHALFNEPLQGEVANTSNIVDIFDGQDDKSRAAAAYNVQRGSGASAEAFSFGDPIAVLGRRELLDYVECVQIER